MSMTDPIADMLSRIRNAQQVGLLKITLPYSTIRASLLDVLQREGYIRSYEVTEEDAVFKVLSVELKYLDGQPAIKFIKRASKPGRRLYSSIRNLQKFYNGLGITILSTSKGLLSDYEARKQNIGGEVLCYVF